MDARLKKAFGGGHCAAKTRFKTCSLIQSSCKGFEDRFGHVVRIIS
jgi:hypothetical protein